MFLDTGGKYNWLMSMCAWSIESKSKASRFEKQFENTHNEKQFENTHNRNERKDWCMCFPSFLLRPIRHCFFPQEASLRED